MCASSPSKKVLLSIIIPSHGRGQPLNQLLSHLLEQITAAHAQDQVEVIVVDDGSYPPLKPCPKHAALAAKWFRINENSGAPTARRNGFQQSCGSYIHFHDSDDDIGPNWLKVLLGKLKNSTPDILLSARKVVSSQGNTFRQQSFVQRFAKQPQKILRRLQYNNCLGPLGGVTFSRQAASKICFSSLASCQDWDMYLDAIVSNSKIVTDHSFYFIKNETYENRISNKLQKKLRGFMQLGRKHQTFSKKHPSTRLFYVYHVQRTFNGHSTRFDYFCTTNNLAIKAAFFKTEIKKRLPQRS